MEEIISRKNRLVVHLKKLGADGGYRRAAGEFLCDGEKLLVEAIRSGAEITAVLTAGPLPEGLPPAVPVYRAGPGILQAVSPLKTAQELLFSCRMARPEPGRGGRGLRILLEGIQDPGNVGTILRTAAAFHVESVLLTEGCADPFHPKTVRASMGAVFRQHVLPVVRDDLVRLRQSGAALYGAALGDGGADVRDMDFKNCVVAIGSEGAGLTDGLLGLCDGIFKIPMAPGSESLNAAVAAAVVMWEAGRQGFGGRVGGTGPAAGGR